MPQLILKSTPDAAADIAAYLVGGCDRPCSDDGNARVEAAAKSKLRELGRRAISRRGCFACHDIPGFDDARPIGPA